MSEELAVHRAAKSAGGYLYQARLAVVEALRYAYVDSSIEIAVGLSTYDQFDRKWALPQR